LPPKSPKGDFRLSTGFAIQNIVSFFASSISSQSGNSYVTALHLPKKQVYGRLPLFSAIFWRYSLLLGDSVRNKKPNFYLIFSNKTTSVARNYPPHKPTSLPHCIDK
jgi:hypothetical protein